MLSNKSIIIIIFIWVYKKECDCTNFKFSAQRKLSKINQMKRKNNIWKYSESDLFIVDDKKRQI